MTKKGAALIVVWRAWSQSLVKIVLNIDIEKLCDDSLRDFGLHQSLFVFN